MSSIFGRKTAITSTGTGKSNAPRIIESYVCEPGQEGRVHILKKHNAKYASLMMNCGYDNLCFVGSDERIEIYGITCKCGSRRLRVTGNKLEGMELLGDPISIMCPECGEKHVIFDSTKQGYDGELGEAYNVTGKAAYTETKAVCVQCGNDTFELTLGFEYPEDIEDTAKAEKREAKDLYTWLTGCAKCEKCGAMGDIIDFECE